MAELLILWGYLFAVNACIGAGTLRVIRRLAFGRQQSKDNRMIADPGTAPECGSILWTELFGVIAITVYAQIFSLFGAVGAAAHLVLLALAALCAFRCRSGLRQMAERVRGILFSWDGVLYLVLILLTALFASRGVQHTDTGIYHAQMIHWYESYGVVRGLGNLQQHFAYNSASLAYAAIFSMKWLVGQSLHGTNGFLQAFLVVFAVRGLRGVTRRSRHLADGCRIAILLYSLVVSERIMSPATDFSSMYLVLWIVTLWAMTQSSPKIQKEEKVHLYTLLCIAAVYVATCKLSAGCLVVLVLYPLLVLLKNREWRRILVYLLCGIFVLVPWLVRNVVISGWLLYPFTSLDLFSVDWKIPAELVTHDADQIKVWGRCLYDVTKIDEPLSVWLPVWWGEKQRSEMMLLLGNGIAAAGLLLGGLCVLWNRHRGKRAKGRETDPAMQSGNTDRDLLDKLVLYLAVLVCLAGWFLTAPFIRYGLAFLLLLSCMVAGEWIRPLRMGFVRIVSGFGCLAIFLCMSMFWDYYVLFDLVWLKQNALSGQYLAQQDYDRPEVETCEIEGGLTVYIPKEGDNISYYAFPGDAYRSMADRAAMRGSRIQDGFRTKTD